MKILFSVALFMLVTLFANAQESIKMNIYDGTTVVFSSEVSSIDSISFGNKMLKVETNSLQTSESLVGKVFVGYRPQNTNNYSTVDVRCQYLGIINESTLVVSAYDSQGNSIYAQTYNYSIEGDLLTFDKFSAIIVGNKALFFKSSTPYVSKYSSSGIRASNVMTAL
ncbi:MAG: hypothetical protein MJZ15_02525 [Bacteroidales bacterium]|nr:hypothetical protein [Bacteroidales bacterium]